MANAANQDASLTDGKTVVPAVTPIKKIRKFRLHARPSAVLRNLKSLLTNEPLTPEIEKAVEAEGLIVEKKLDSAALFDTGGPFGPFLKNPAVTLFVATIGLPIETELAEALSRGEGLRSRILTAFGEELADQAANFVERLVAEEARQDSCELEERQVLSSGDEIQNALSRLDAGRLSITYDSGGHFSPRFTRVGVLPWGPPAKKK